MRAVILFGHGSRDPLWRQPMEAVAARVAAAGTLVRCAFLELERPTLAEAAADAVAAGATELAVLPMFLGVGRHARADLPELLAQLQAQHPGLAIDCKPAVGEDPRVLELLARIALE